MYSMIDCCICLMPIDENNYTLQCKHNFHEMCIMKWLQTGSNKCPYCRDKINDDSSDDYVYSRPLQVDYYMSSDSSTDDSSSDDIYYRHSDPNVIKCWRCHYDVPPTYLTKINVRGRIKPVHIYCTGDYPTVNV